MKKRLYLNTATSLLAQIVTVVCGFVLPRLILMSYGSEVNGLIQSIAQFLGIITFLEMGVGQVIQSNLYQPLARQDEQQISRVLKSGERYFHNIAYALLGYIGILILVFPYVAKLQFDWWYTATLIVTISIGSFVRYYFGIIDRILLNADQRGYIQYSAQIITTILNTVICIVVMRMGLSIQTVKLCSSLVFLLGPLMIRWYISKNYTLDRKVKYEGEPIQQKWNGIAQHVSSVVLEGTDNIVLTLFSTLSNVSIYSVYFMVISGIRQFYVAATNGIQSAVGSLWAKGEWNALKIVFSVMEMTLHLVVVFLFCCIGLLIIPFVQVYTEGLTDANYTQPVFAAVLTLAYAVRCLRTPYNILILAGGHYKQTQRCHIVAAILNLGISIVAVSMWGLVGIALGTLVAITYQTGWMMVYDSKNLLQWPLKKVMKQLAVDAVTAVCIFGAAGWMKMREVSYWAWFCMALPVAMIALIVTVLAAMLFYRNEVLILLGALKTKWKNDR